MISSFHGMIPSFHGMISSFHAVFVLRHRDKSTKVIDYNDQVIRVRGYLLFMGISSPMFLLLSHFLLYLCGASFQGYGHKKTPGQMPQSKTISLPFRCGATRNRTGDTRIFSPLLYQLSYGTSLLCGHKGRTKIPFLQIFLHHFLHSPFWRVLEWDHQIYQGATMTIYRKTYSPSLSLRFSTRNIRKDDDLLNLPLFRVIFFGECYFRFSLVFFVVPIMFCAFATIIMFI